MKYLYFFLSVLLVQPVFAQSKLVVIKAMSKRVSIKDGDYFNKNAWTLSPEKKPDIFTAERSRKTKWVTFYTDIDSISVKVRPGTVYNFVILLNGKDSCYTQIASAIPPENKNNDNITENDTIPFTLTAFNAIKVKAVINNTDTLNLHFDTGSWDFRLTKDAILNKTKLLSNQPGALAGKVYPDYNNLSKVFKLQIGNLVWSNPEIAATQLTARDMDGRFGWNVFEGKMVEVNYDNDLIIIHSKHIKAPNGYIRSKLEFMHSFICVKGNFKIDDKKYFGNFLMDTGSGEAIILDSAWVSDQKFPKNLKLLKSLVLKNPKGIKFETKIVLSPAFKINDFELTNIPTSILGSKNPAGFGINNLGNDFLKRFNMILDLKNDYIYLKPNKLTGLKYKESS